MGHNASPSDVKSIFPSSLHFPSPSTLINLFLPRVRRDLGSTPENPPGNEACLSRRWGALAAYIVKNPPSWPARHLFHFPEKAPPPPLEKLNYA